MLGSLAFDKKDFEAAKNLYMQSTAADPARSFSAWQRLGVIYKKEGRTGKAIEAFETARKSYPRYVGPDNPHHELPDLYEDMEPPQSDKALVVWKDAVSINTEDKEAALNGLKLAIKLKDYKAATFFTTSAGAVGFSGPCARKRTLASPIISFIVPSVGIDGIFR